MEATLRACELRIEGMSRRLAEWEAMQAHRLAMRKKPLGSVPDFSSEMAADREAATAHEAKLSLLRGARAREARHGRRKRAGVEHEEAVALGEPRALDARHAARLPGHAIPADRSTLKRA